MGCRHDGTSDGQEDVNGSKVLALCPARPRKEWISEGARRKCDGRRFSGPPSLDSSVSSAPHAMRDKDWPMRPQGGCCVRAGQICSAASWREKIKAAGLTSNSRRQCCSLLDKRGHKMMGKTTYNEKLQWLHVAGAKISPTLFKCRCSKSDVLILAKPLTAPMSALKSNIW